jgi:hypothetical protein
MTLDRYSKVMLTIIAICQITNVIKQNQIIPPAMAQQGPVHVIIDSVASYAFQYAGPLQVTGR